MNKRNTRAFAFGILIAVIAFGTAYFLNKPEQSEQRIMDENSAKKLLQANGYTVLTDEEYALLQQTEAKDQDEKKEVKEEPAEENTEQEEESQKVYKLTIERGMTPGEIAALLEKASVIDQAADFGNYLEEYGFSKKIQLGTFELTQNMSYKEIAKIITKS
ncbi:hypothetical protein ABE29_09540 [Cytobacillus firmus]|uniref:Aminodeoxychorismate lyase n=1 Tax=Cytobacillus firmus DS1 TaxID=1307436 RepID=W7L1F0_CYTFI|nr:endolytic transglycosylase MltG [Cytobacillus firmus]EWG08942.1 hypothetical protein PBF_21738 [Cytobacillus firmus DS1]MBG9543021.1 hypothetical protein [Cytobacillus firmus]MBG9552281.1 hypothetical protein [Cytobacillus firmus]MBG9557429.1 hypothetical protein [Cytobacillus firmus]MBG9575680.1 hypothetical protein [Cytobacillus firmus]